MKNWFILTILAPFVFYAFYTEAKTTLKGKVKIDGSSTVFPISEAVAEEYNKVNPRVRVTIGVSGTGGGFKKFCAGETDINDASRPIKEKEITKCAKNKVSYTKIPVAYDGISVILNKKNTWATELTMADLKKIWEPGSKVSKWSDINKSWPAKTIKLYGPGSDSGTFDYFTKKINGKEGASRSNYTASENDNIIISGVAMDQYALGYVGFAYYEANQKKLKVASIKGIKPSLSTIKTVDSSKKYVLSRLIYIYVNKKSVTRPEVNSFISFYIQNAKEMSAAVGYVPLNNSRYTSEYKTFAKLATPVRKK